jgi:hypothetical protein
MKPQYISYNIIRYRDEWSDANITIRMTNVETAQRRWKREVNNCLLKGLERYRG